MHYYAYISDIGDDRREITGRVRGFSRLDDARKHLLKTLDRKADYYVGVVAKVKNPHRISDILGIVTRDRAWTDYYGTWQRYIGNDGKALRK